MSNTTSPAIYHLHPIYHNLNCGVESFGEGIIFTTNEKHVTCPDCQRRLKGEPPLMQIDDYLRAYAEFNTEFCPNETDEEILLGVVDETDEMLNASSEAACLDELLDVMNRSIKAVHRLISKDPLHAGYEKLQRTAMKYRAQR